MTEQLHFIVERTPIGFQPATVDRLPDKYQGKRAKLNGLVYHFRIDDRPDLPREPQRLFALWRQHGGKLPKPANQVWPMLAIALVMVLAACVPAYDQHGRARGAEFCLAPYGWLYYPEGGPYWHHDCAPAESGVWIAQPHRYP